MDIKELQNIIQENGVVGAGGAGFPTYMKLTDKADTILMNCAECSFTVVPPAWATTSSSVHPNGTFTVTGFSTSATTETYLLVTGLCSSTARYTL